MLLSVRDEDSFPLLFYRDNCADMALCEDDIDLEFISSSHSIVVTGTHFSTLKVESASRKAIDFAKQSDSQVIFDVDYRPNLWGTSRTRCWRANDLLLQIRYRKRLQSIVAHCDLVVGYRRGVAYCRWSQ